MKKVLLYGFAIALLACHKGNSPSAPDPIPDPTPTPVVSHRPAWPFGVVYCCNNNPGWPLVTDGQLREMADAGATMTHMRTGPFEDGSEDAAATTMPLLRHAVETATGLGISTEVDLIDGWALVNHVNRWHDGCDVTQKAPSQRYIDHITLVVNTVKDLNVTFHIGNEMYRCGPSTAWLQGIYDAAKRAGAGRIGSDDSRVGDYLTVHGFSPTSNGTVLNETDNRDYTAAQWVWLYQESKKRAGYIMIWFGPSDDERRAEILEAMKHVDEGVAAACIVPPSDDDPRWEVSSPYGAEMKDAVLAAVRTVPETCGNPSFSNGFAQIEKVAAALTSRGVCADRSNDALFVKNSRDKYEEYHIFSYRTGCWATDPHVLPKNIWTWRG